jgi:plasmid stability protein
MANVTIRNLDDEVVKTLKTQAKEHNRSLEAELRRLLTEAAEARKRRTAFWKEAKRLRKMTPGDRPQTDSVELLREDRWR